MGRTLARQLGYRLVDEELPRLIAARLGVPSDVAESVVERPPGFAERVLAGLTSAVPETAQPAAHPTDDLRREYRREAERLMHEAAEQGDAIIVGRLGAAVLRGRPDVLRVFLHAPLAWRVEHVATSLRCEPALARCEITRIDNARRAYAREQYGMAWDDLHSYDLVLDIACFGVEGAAQTIAAAVHAAA